MWKLQPRQTILQLWRCGKGCCQKMDSLQRVSENDCKPTFAFEHSQDWTDA